MGVIIFKCCKALQRYNKSFLKCFCPPIYYLLYSAYPQGRCIKTICGFFYGALVGGLFYYFVLCNLGFSSFVANSIGAFLSLMLAFGNATSIQIRCITLLTVPNFLGEAGRSCLRAMVLALVITGPIANLARNSREVVRVFACSTGLTYNLTKTRFDLMAKPFQEAIFGVKADLTEVKDTLRSIRDVASPIVEEVEDEGEMMKIEEENDYLDITQKDSKRSVDIKVKYSVNPEEDEAKRYEKMYMKKLESRCESQLTKGANKCRTMFAKAYDKCYETVSWVAAWLLCWPMKLTFVCNIAQAIGGSGSSGGPCDIEQEVDPGFGMGYSYLKKSKGAMSSNFQQVKVQYKILKPENIVNVREVTDTATAVMHQFNERRSVFDALLSFFQKILTFVFLKILIHAQNYHDKYLTDIDHDNIYITGYFRKIDARRQQIGKHTLLPLKKIEKLKFLDPFSISQGKFERNRFTRQIVKLILEMITATTFVLLDRLFFETLDLVGRHGHIEYTQEGHHDMKLEVKGTGMIASLVRSVVKGFNVKKRIKVVRSNSKCLPRATVLHNNYLYKIYITYLITILFTISQAYTERLRRVICSYFYPKREKRRVLHLYNSGLKKRQGLFRYMQKRVAALVKQHKLSQDVNFFLALRLCHPKHCSWLIMFPAARRKCVICREPESSNRGEGAFKSCPNPECHFVYCPECWIDVHGVCIACSDPGDESDGADFSGFESDVES